MKRCDRFEREGLSLLERGKPLGRHFDTCEDCLTARRTYVRLHQEIAKVGDDLQPSPDWRARVWGAIEAEKEQQEDEDVSRIRDRFAWFRSKISWFFQPPLGSLAHFAAAMAVVAVVVGVLIVAQRLMTTSRQSEPAAQLQLGGQDAIVQRAAAHLIRGELNLAVSYYEMALAEGPHVGASMSLGNLLYFRGDYPAALEAFEGATRRSSAAPDPDARESTDGFDPLALTRVADVLRQLGRTEEAEQAYRQALQQYEVVVADNRADSVAGAQMNVVLASLGRCDEVATQAFVRVLRSVPAVPEGGPESQRQRGGSTSLAAATGTIDGTVLDANGELVPGARVTATSSVFSTLVFTGSDGRYSLKLLPPGVYQVNVSLAGFTSSMRRYVVVGAERTTSVGFRISADEGPTEVFVSSPPAVVDVRTTKRDAAATNQSAAVVDVRSTKRASDVSDELRDTLPNPRILVDLMGGPDAAATNQSAAYYFLQAAARCQQTEEAIELASALISERVFLLEISMDPELAAVRDQPAIRERLDGVFQERPWLIGFR